MPKGKHVVRFLAGRPEFAGIGPATAQRLWDTFGENLYRILGDGAVDLLAEILPRTQAEIVCDAWANQRAITDTVVFFDENGIGGHLARKAVDFWGEEAVAKVRENPFRLLTVCSWKQVDHMARAMGFGPGDPRRQVGAVEAALYERLDEKHTVTPEEVLLKRAARLLGASQEAARQALGAAVEDGAAIPAAAGYQPAGAAYAERYIEERIRAALEAPERQKDLLAERETSPPAVEAFLGLYNTRAEYPLTDEQAEAVRMVLRSRFSIVTGGAGVGKTTTLKAIHGAASRFGLHVYQLALAGRAAQRMSDATEQAAQTIASWLSQASRREAETGAHTLVVVDEASMLDLPTLYRLLFHLDEDARVLLVGDVAQLPPIGFGLTLHRLVESLRIPQVELTRILRADETTGIPLVSRTIRAGQVPPLPDYEAGRLGCSFIGCCQSDIISEIERIRDDLRDEETQIVGATYVGPAGIDAINTHFHRYNSHGKPRMGRFAVDDPVIWLENDYERQLWNGSMGRVLSVQGGRLEVCLDGRTFDLDRDEFAGRLDLAYAISTHKAQGSQWGTVIVPLVPNRLMDRALLYTALTRAQQRVVVIGHGELLEKIVTHAPASLMRDVALSV
ncbi:AAA family ATPase [Teichococcus aestuarii]|uniref:AAA family ATPase n=1 Tax=Teichococcus aestuarii TaxID=568898 RepID=UPI0015E7F609|nr:AAA family ATPase [Pseudoroseomonas aestuarii]